MICRDIKRVLHTDGYPHTRRSSWSSFPGCGDGARPLNCSFLPNVSIVRNTGQDTLPSKIETHQTETVWTVCTAVLSKPPRTGAAKRSVSMPNQADNERVLSSVCGATETEVCVYVVLSGVWKVELLFFVFMSVRE